MRCADLDLLTSIALALPENPIPVLQHIAGCDECKAAVRDCRELRDLLLDPPLTERQLREMVVVALDSEERVPAVPHTTWTAAEGHMEGSSLGQRATVFVCATVVAIVVLLIGSVGGSGEGAWPAFVVIPLLAATIVTTVMHRRNLSATLTDLHPSARDAI